MSQNLHQTSIHKCSLSPESTKELKKIGSKKTTKQQKRYVKPIRSPKSLEAIL